MQTNVESSRKTRAFKMTSWYLYGELIWKADILEQLQTLIGSIWLVCIFSSSFSSFWEWNEWVPTSSSNPAWATCVRSTTALNASKRQKNTHTLKIRLGRLLFPQNWLWGLRLLCEAGGSLRKVHDSTVGAGFKGGWGQLRCSHSTSRTIKVGLRQDSGFMNLENGGGKKLSMYLHI